MRHMRFNRYSALALAGVLLALAPTAASVQEVALVAPDAKEVAKGYRADELKLRSVVNDKGEIIGHIDDFIFGRDNGPVFVVLSVGDYVGLGAELVAVPFKSLKLDDSSGKIVLPGASLAALRKLAVDPSTVQATMANGVLEIAIPKPAPTETKKIEVKEAA
jgi:hypothetical protein